MKNSHIWLSEFALLTLLFSSKLLAADEAEELRREALANFGKNHCTVTMLKTVKNERGFAAEKDKQYLQAVGVGLKVHAASDSGFEAIPVEATDIQSDCKLPDFVPFDQTESMLFADVDIYPSPEFTGKPVCAFPAGSILDGFFRAYLPDKKYSTISEIPGMKAKCGIEKGYTRQVMYAGKLIKKDQPKPSRFRRNNNG